MDEIREVGEEEVQEGMKNVEGVSSEEHASSSNPRKRSGKEVETGESSKAASHPSFPTPTQVGENRGIFMFEMRLTQSNIEQKELVIPVELAFDYFNPVFHHRNALWVNLTLTDPENLMFSVSLWIDPVENSFAIQGDWWEQFVERYNVEAMDVILFYKPFQPSQETDLLINFVKTRSSSNVSIPTQVGENFGIEGSGVIQEQEEKESGMENLEEGVSLEGHASSLNPRKQSGKEIATGESSKAARKNVDPPTPTQVGENMGILIFEMRLSQRNIERNKLVIRGELAFDYFHPIFTPRNTLWVDLTLTDPENLMYAISLWFDPVERSFSIEGVWWKRFVQRYNVEAMDVIRFYKPFQASQETDLLIDFVKTRSSTTSIPARVGENIGIFLFEISLLEMGRLEIPEELASPFFPPLANRQDYSRTIQVTGPGNVSLNMRMTFDISENAFVHEGDLWKELFRLEARDVIRFHRPLPRAHPYHFLVDFIRSIPEFKPENFLFQLECSGYAIGFRRLLVPTEDVRHHFPYVTENEMRMRFTDAENKSWLIKIVFTSHVYMLVLEEDFVIQNRLQDGDVIRFYKPIRPMHRLHFLIEFVKRPVAARTDPTPSTTDDPTQSGNPGSKKQGGGGGRGGKKHSGGRKEMKFPFGDCCVT